MKKHIPIKDITFAYGMNMPFEKRCTEHPHWCELKIGGVHNVRCEPLANNNQSAPENERGEISRNTGKGIRTLAAGINKDPNKIFSLMPFFSAAVAVASFFLLRGLSKSAIGISTSWCLFCIAIGFFLLHAYLVVSCCFSPNKPAAVRSMSRTAGKRPDASAFLCLENASTTTQCIYRTTTPRPLNATDWYTR